MTNAILIYLSLIFVMSVVCFAAYGLDKRRAGNGGRRVPEQTLHILALLGGWPGALLGQQQFRHKTKKLSFLIVFWFVVVLHVGIVGTAAYLCFGSGSSGTLTVKTKCVDLVGQYRPDRMTACTTVLTRLLIHAD